MNWLYLLVALAGGIGLPVQAAMNNQLKRYIGGPAWAAMTSIAVSAISIIIFLAIARPALPAATALGEAPRWAWIGGLFGAFFVAVGVIVTPKLGTAATFSTVVAGQVLVSLALDQWGWIGLPVHQLSPGRLAGAALLVIGVLMVQRL